MNYNCRICDKAETCKKNKNSNTSNCRLFIPSKEKELAYLKERQEAREKLAKINKKFRTPGVSSAFSVKEMKKWQK